VYEDDRIEVTPVNEITPAIRTKIDSDYKIGDQNGNMKITN